MLGTRLHPPVASESQDMMPGASGLGSGWEDRGQGQRASGFHGFEIQAMSCGRVQHQLFLLPAPNLPSPVS